MVSHSMSTRFPKRRYSKIHGRSYDKIMHLDNLSEEYARVSFEILFM